VQTNKAPSLVDDFAPRARRRSRVKRILIGTAIVVALLCVAGVAYQSLSERRDLQDHPAPGRLVDVGDHRLHLYCTGSGTPTVLLEAGLGNDVNHWALVQPGIAGFTRVCAYDRAGLGWSDAGPLPRDASRIVGELGRLLERSGEHPPYVIVGHSNGAPYARLYAAAHPDRVAGLVLLDANPENAPSCDELPVSTHALYGSLATLAPVGVPRLSLPSLFPLERSSLPPEQREIHGALRARTSALRALWSEWKNTCAMLADVRAAEPPGAGVPVVVLAAAEKPHGPFDVTQLQRQMAERLGASEFVVVDESGHWIQLDRPEAVVDAVRRVVDKVRGEPGT
jgi:pimeloyl-ACP methyl ester carboxylesterase